MFLKFTWHEQKILVKLDEKVERKLSENTLDFAGD